MEKLSFKLRDFEGPLDLLLYLVNKHQLNLADIPVVQLVDQYLEHVDLMQQEDMDVASEFLEMASRLVYLKTVMLLPKAPEAEELKTELEDRLQEYAICREMAEKLKESATGFGSRVRAPMQMDFDKAYTRIHPSEILRDAYLSAVGRGERRLPPPAEAFAGIMKKKIVSVSSKIVYVIRRLWKGTNLPFQHLFAAAKTRSDLVATFLAVLELIKVRRVEITNSGEQAMIHLNKGGKSDGAEESVG